MGYVQDTKMSQIIPVSHMILTAGTWTMTVASNVCIHTRTAAAATFNALVPIPIPQNYVALKGARLLSVDFLWKNATADLNSVTTVEIEKVAMAANTVAPTGAALACTIDASNDTTAKRITQAQHTLNISPTAPEWLDSAYAYWLYMTFDAAATSALILYGARANYLLRL
jgi:hypothetical protein